MKLLEYKTKTGATQLRPSMTEEEYWRSDCDMNGFCLACGEEAYGVEPDARRYECESCGVNKVYGYQELMMMGLITITKVTSK